MLVLNNISFEFGSRYLYKDASWHIKPNEKIGLIGANGTGKSTLLRIIAGEYKVSEGNITRRKDLVIGFLNQDLLSYQTDDSILKVAMQAFEKANKLNEEIHEILEKLEHDHSDEILHKLHDKQAAFEALDGYNLEYKAEEVLEGLGFSTEALQRPLKEFSGGWRMRVMLAKILLQKPDLLLLDEPTNHLDLPSIKWIENYLHNYEGTVVIVSHDRYFLDGICEKIAEVHGSKINLYTGNFEDYVIQKAEREDLQRNQFKNQEKYIKEQEKLIDRFRAKASKAKMAQSRIKALDKLERFEDVDDSKSAMKLNFKFSQQPGRILSQLDIDAKEFPSSVIFDDTKSLIERGDKIALIGANGRGKSTLLRMIDGSEDFIGKTAETYNVIKSFFAQHQMEALNLDNDLITELQFEAPEQSDTVLRSLLGAFLFTGDDVFKKIKVLSGGEKSRLALAKTILSKANFLILDEPTNHLDMLSVNILIDVLLDYEGTFIVVSHDRFFLSSVANKIWWIEDQKIRVYPGTYDEFELWQESLKEKEKTNIKKETPKPQEIKKVTESKDQKEEEAKLKKEFKKATQEFNEVDQQLSQLKKDKATIETQMHAPEVYEDRLKLTSLTQKYAKIEIQIKNMEANWEKLFDNLSKYEHLKASL